MKVRERPPVESPKISEVIEDKSPLPVTKTLSIDPKAESTARKKGIKLFTSTLAKGFDAVFWPDLNSTLASEHVKTLPLKQKGIIFIPETASPSDLGIKETSSQDASGKKITIMDFFNGLTTNDNPQPIVEDLILKGQVHEEMQKDSSRRERARRKAKQKTLSIGKKMANPIITGVTGSFMQRVDSKWVPSITPETPDNFEEALAERTKNPNTITVVVSNHWDHGQLVEEMVASKMTKDLINSHRSPENQIKGAKLIVAKSLEDGLQAWFLQSGLAYAEKKYFPKYNLSTLPMVTINDQDRRHMDKAKNIGPMKQLIKLAREKNEIVEIFPEGSIDGGRFTNGVRNGMQLFIPQLDRILEILTAEDAEIVFVPFGSWGENRVHTNHRMPTWAALKTLYFEKNPESLVNMKMGMPITLTEIKDRIQKQRGREASPEDVRDYLARECVAPLVPIDFQGVYRKT